MPLKYTIMHVQWKPSSKFALRHQPPKKVYKTCAHIKMWILSDSLATG